MFEAILDIIYPNCCGICNRICKEGLCKRCEMIIEPYNINKVIDCINDNSKYFDYSYSIFKYEDIIRQKIVEYKFGDKAYLYKFFSKIIIKNVKKIELFKNNYDVIIPVPISKKRKRERGYNQSFLIARELNKELNVETEEALIKIKDVPMQSSLSKKERLQNVKNVYDIKDTYKIKGKRILLFDDIYTTGSTVNECSKILIQNSAKNVDVLTIAKD